MKDFIQQLQQFTKAWGIHKSILKDKGYWINDDGYFCIVDTIHNGIAHRVGNDFDVHEGLFNTTIESEGVVVKVDKQTKYIDNGYVHIYTPMYYSELDGEYKDLGISFTGRIESEKRKIIEAFKLIEQGNG